MNALRLWLVSIWLIFATLAPAHAATMNHAACDMTMPHAPAHHSMPNDSAMPCCSVPLAIAPEAPLILPERDVVFVKPAPFTAPRLDGVNPPSDPHPPKKLEA